jgi:Tol biopolymer transport system component
MSLLLAVFVFVAMGFGATFPSDELTSTNNIFSYLIDLRTGIQQRFPHYEVSTTNAIWSPDRTQIAYEQYTGREIRSAIYVSDAVGREVWYLGAGYRPVWSPDGRYIALWWDDDIYIADLVSDNSARIITNLRGYHSFSWSPDSSRLAYGDINLTNDPSIYVLTISTGEKHWLAFGENPAWSPDGTQIAYNQNSWIVVISAEGGTETRIVGGYDPTWSPDGVYIAYNSFPSRRYVMLVSSEGGIPTLIADGFNPIWSPDGEWLAYSTGEPFEADLALYQLESGRIFTLVSNFYSNRATSWRP